MQRMRRELGMLEVRVDGAAPPRIAVGVWAKVSLRSEGGSERFWVRIVRERVDGTLEARVENDLQLNSYKCGDAMEVRAEQVLETADEADRLAFSSLVAAMDSEVHGALAWHAMRESGL